MAKFAKGLAFKAGGKAKKKTKARNPGGGGLSFNFGANVKKGASGGGS